MEQLFPFLIGIAFFIFRIYTNFQKEQEKSKKRTIAVPEAQYIPENTPHEKPLTQHYEREPFLLEEYPNPDNPYEPEYRQTYREPKPEQPAKEEVYQRMRAETMELPEKYVQEPVAEWTNNRRIHKPHKHTVTRVKQEELVDEVYDFNMRDAIIQQAILNRPKY